MGKYSAGSGHQGPPISSPISEDMNRVRQGSYIFNVINQTHIDRQTNRKKLAVRWGSALGDPVTER